MTITKLSPFILLPILFPLRIFNSNACKISIEIHWLQKFKDKTKDF